MSDTVQASEVKYDLKAFKLIKVLNNLSNRKIVYLLGYFEDLSSEDKAVVILEKKAFAEESLPNYFCDTQSKVQFVNDIYANIELFPKIDVNSIKVTVVYPATEEHIQKYSVQNVYIVNETPELHKSITKPYVKEQQFTLDWVYNILDHKKEFERILFEDPCEKTGFILLPDLKWDGQTKETLYCLAIVRRRDLHTIRDLNSSHLPLLNNIRDTGIETIENKFGIGRSQLRIYFHYLPSFYHLHVHFTYLKFDAPGIFCERSHLLDGVINNIVLMPDYYQKSTLSYTIRECDKLYDTLFSVSDQPKEIDETIAVKQ